MARAPANETIEVAPSNNVYTVLAAAGVVALILGLIVLVMRANTLGVKFW